MNVTTIVTRNVSGRIRGFLASSMLELAPGVYSSPRQSSRVRDQIWSVLSEWFVEEKDASIIMLWADPEMPGGQNIRVLGLPPIDLVEMDGIVLSRTDLPTPREEKDSVFGPCRKP
ncbi:MAG: type I-E CRISPR-associated endoribonuclease Cas2 [Desulfococcus sp. 4484_241]|nr:MAG: type I-E CRISPR-associated endoribonuclease Cas2 [Desulfococcus sp. 4484_241]